MALKERLYQDLIAPVAKNHSAIFLNAVIVKSYEESNCCDVAYYDHNNYKQVRKRVPVMLRSETIIDWFPNIGDQVLISITNGKEVIMGPGYATNYGYLKSKNILKQDILSDASTSFVGGFIF